MLQGVPASSSSVVPRLQPWEAPPAFPPPSIDIAFSVPAELERSGRARARPGGATDSAAAAAAAAAAAGSVVPGAGAATCMLTVAVAVMLIAATPAPPAQRSIPHFPAKPAAIAVVHAMDRVCVWH